MGPYHAVMSHFPVALWLTATLVIVIRVFSDRQLARNLGRVLVPLLALGAVTGAITFALGFLVWPYEALSASPLGRNHLLMASWSLGYWTMLLFIAWRHGETLWHGVSRWIILGLGILGADLLAITGALGGHLIGNPTMVSDVLRLLGWEVYTTFYLPTTMLVIIGAAVLALLAIAIHGRRQPG
ncbi:heme ABC transporter permease [Arsukibacterium ikkense]|uniref:Heme ABC transporter permease n=1 Tax=Arsukibacterium ikkense TaxID=336831 RepID=A0A0M2V671_9GAMM|nr:DUF2231 domain-containing protein [Arsukibacterium ikkense]KKO44663.1 heme ABC transporter permease [Arsukibacterium ikkense]